MQMHANSLKISDQFMRQTNSARYGLTSANSRAASAKPSRVISAISTKYDILTETDPNPIFQFQDTSLPRPIFSATTYTTTRGISTDHVPLEKISIDQTINPELYLFKGRITSAKMIESKIETESYLEKIRKNKPKRTESAQPREQTPLLKLSKPNADRFFLVKSAKSTFGQKERVVQSPVLIQDQNTPNKSVVTIEEAEIDSNLTGSDFKIRRKSGKIGLRPTTSKPVTLKPIVEEEQEQDANAHNISNYVDTEAFLKSLEVPPKPKLETIFSYNPQIARKMFNSTAIVPIEETDFTRPIPHRLFNDQARTLFSESLLSQQATYTTPSDRIARLMHSASNLSPEHLPYFIKPIYQKTKSQFLPIQYEWFVIGMPDQPIHFNGTSIPLSHDQFDLVKSFGIFPEQVSKVITDRFRIDPVSLTFDQKLYLEKFSGFLAFQEHLLQLMKKTYDPDVLLSFYPSFDDSHNSESLKNFRNLLEDPQIKDNLLEKINQKWLERAIDLADQQLLSKFPRQTTFLIEEIIRDFIIASKRAILLYILRDPATRKRMQISTIPRPFPSSSEIIHSFGGYSKDFFPNWSRHFESAKDFLSKHQSAICGRIQKINEWFFEFSNMELFERSLSSELRQRANTLSFPAFLSLQKLYNKVMRLFIMHIISRGFLTLYHLGIHMKPLVSGLTIWTLASPMSHKKTQSFPTSVGLLYGNKTSLVNNLIQEFCNSSSLDTSEIGTIQLFMSMFQAIVKDSPTSLRYHSIPPKLNPSPAPYKKVETLILQFVLEILPKNIKEFVNWLEDESSKHKDKFTLGMFCLDVEIADKKVVMRDSLETIHANFAELTRDIFNTFDCFKNLFKRKLADCEDRNSLDLKMGLERADISSVLLENKQSLPKEYTSRMEGFLIECNYYFSEFCSRWQLFSLDSTNFDSEPDEFCEKYNQVKQTAKDISMEALTRLTTLISSNYEKAQQSLKQFNVMNSFINGNFAQQVEEAFRENKESEVMKAVVKFEGCEKNIKTLVPVIHAGLFSVDSERIIRSLYKDLVDLRQKSGKKLEVNLTTRVLSIKTRYDQLDDALRQPVTDHLKYAAFERLRITVSEEAVILRTKSKEVSDEAIRYLSSGAIEGSSILLETLRDLCKKPAELDDRFKAAEERTAFEVVSLHEKLATTKLDLDARVLNFHRLPNFTDLSNYATIYETCALAKDELDESVRIQESIAEQEQALFGKASPEIEALTQWKLHVNPPYKLWKVCSESMELLSKTNRTFLVDLRREDIVLIENALSNIQKMIGEFESESSQKILQALKDEFYDLSISTSVLNKISEQKLKKRHFALLNLNEHSSVINILPGYNPEFAGMIEGVFKQAENEDRIEEHIGKISSELQIIKVSNAFSDHDSLRELIDRLLEIKTDLQSFGGKNWFMEDERQNLLKNLSESIEAFQQVKNLMELIDQCYVLSNIGEVRLGFPVEFDEITSIKTELEAIQSQILQSTIVTSLNIGQEFFWNARCLAEKAKTFINKQNTFVHAAQEKYPVLYLLPRSLLVKFLILESGSVSFKYLEKATKIVLPQVTNLISFEQSAIRGINTEDETIEFSEDLFLLTQSSTELFKILIGKIKDQMKHSLVTMWQDYKDLPFAQRITKPEFISNSQAQFLLIRIDYEIERIIFGDTEEWKDSKVEAEELHLVRKSHFSPDYSFIKEIQKDVDKHGRCCVAYAKLEQFNIDFSNLLREFWSDVSMRRKIKAMIMKVTEWKNLLNGVILNKSFTFLNMSFLKVPSDSLKSGSVDREDILFLSSRGVQITYGFEPMSLKYFGPVSDLAHFEFAKAVARSDVFVINSSPNFVQSALVSTISEKIGSTIHTISIGNYSSHDIDVLVYSSWREAFWINLLAETAQECHDLAVRVVGISQVRQGQSKLIVGSRELQNLPTYASSMIATVNMSEKAVYFSEFCKDCMRVAGIIECSLSSIIELQLTALEIPDAQVLSKKINFVSEILSSLFLRDIGAFSTEVFKTHKRTLTTLASPSSKLYVKSFVENIKEQFFSKLEEEQLVIFSRHLISIFELEIEVPKVLPGKIEESEVIKMSEFSSQDVSLHAPQSKKWTKIFEEFDCSPIIIHGNFDPNKLIFEENGFEVAFSESEIESAKSNKNQLIINNKGIKDEFASNCKIEGKQVVYFFENLDDLSPHQLTDYKIVKIPKDDDMTFEDYLYKKIELISQNHFNVRQEISMIQCLAKKLLLRSLIWLSKKEENSTLLKIEYFDTTCRIFEQMIHHSEFKNKDSQDVKDLLANLLLNSFLMNRSFFNSSFTQYISKKLIKWKKYDKNNVSYVLSSSTFPQADIHKSFFFNGIWKINPINESFKSKFAHFINLLAFKVSFGVEFNSIVEQEIFCSQIIKSLSEKIIHFSFSNGYSFKDFVSTLLSFAKLTKSDTYKVNSQIVVLISNVEKMIDPTPLIDLVRKSIFVDGKFFNIRNLVLILASSEKLPSFVGHFPIFKIDKNIDFFKMKIIKDLEENNIIMPEIEIQNFLKLTEDLNKQKLLHSIDISIKEAIRSSKKLDDIFNEVINSYDQLDFEEESIKNTSGSSTAVDYFLNGNVTFIFSNDFQRKSLKSNIHLSMPGSTIEVDEVPQFNTISKLKKKIISSLVVKQPIYVCLNIEQMENLRIRQFIGSVIDVSNLEIEFDSYDLIPLNKNRGEGESEELDISVLRDQIKKYTRVVYFSRQESRSNPLLQDYISKTKIWDLRYLNPKSIFASLDWVPEESLKKVEGIITKFWKRSEKIIDLGLRLKFYFFKFSEMINKEIIERERAVIAVTNYESLKEFLDNSPEYLSEELQILKQKETTLSQFTSDIARIQNTIKEENLDSKYSELVSNFNTSQQLKSDWENFTITCEQRLHDTRTKIPSYDDKAILLGSNAGEFSKGCRTLMLAVLCMIKPALLTKIKEISSDNPTAVSKVNKFFGTQGTALKKTLLALNPMGLKPTLKKQIWEKIYCKKDINLKKGELIKPILQIVSEICSIFVFDYQFRVNFEPSMKLLEVWDTTTIFEYQEVFMKFNDFQNSVKTKSQKIKTLTSEINSQKEEISKLQVRQGVIKKIFDSVTFDMLRKWKKAQRKALELKKHSTTLALHLSIFTVFSDGSDENFMCSLENELESSFGLQDKLMVFMTQLINNPIVKIKGNYTYRFFTEFIIDRLFVDRENYEFKAMPYSSRRGMITTYCPSAIIGHVAEVEAMAKASNKFETIVILNHEDFTKESLTPSHTSFYLLKNLTQSQIDEIKNFQELNSLLLFSEKPNIPDFEFTFEVTYVNRTDAEKLIWIEQQLQFAYEPEISTKLDEASRRIHDSKNSIRKCRSKIRDLLNDLEINESAFYHTYQEYVYHQDKLNEAIEEKTTCLEKLPKFTSVSKKISDSFSICEAFIEKDLISRLSLTEIFTMLRSTVSKKRSKNLIEINDESIFRTFVEIVFKILSARLSFESKLILAFWLSLFLKNGILLNQLSTIQLNAINSLLGIGNTSVFTNSMSGKKKVGLVEFGAADERLQRVLHSRSKIGGPIEYRELKVCAKKSLQDLQDNELFQSLGLIEKLAIINAWRPDNLPQALLSFAQENFGVKVVSNIELCKSVNLSMALDFCKEKFVILFGDQIRNRVNPCRLTRFKDKEEISQFYYDGKNEEAIEKSLRTLLMKSQLVIIDNIQSSPHLLSFVQNLSLLLIDNPQKVNKDFKIVMTISNLLPIAKPLSNTFLGSTLRLNLDSILDSTSIKQADFISGCLSYKSESVPQMSKVNSQILLSLFTHINRIALEMQIHFFSPLTLMKFLVPNVTLESFINNIKLKFIQYMNDVPNPVKSPSSLFDDLLHIAFSKIQPTDIPELSPKCLKNIHQVFSSLEKPDQSPKEINSSLKINAHKTLRRARNELAECKSSVLKLILKKEFLTIEPLMHSDLVSSLAVTKIENMIEVCRNSAKNVKSISMIPNNILFLLLWKGEMNLKVEISKENEHEGEYSINTLFLEDDFYSENYKWNSNKKTLVKADHRGENLLPKLKLSRVKEEATSEMIFSLGPKEELKVVNGISIELFNKEMAKVSLKVKPF